MNLGCKVSEDYMVAAFLKAELGSPRWRQHVLFELATKMHPRSIINTPDLDDDTENMARAEVLYYRGYGHNIWLFTGFPTDVVWRLAMCKPSDLRCIKDVECAPFKPDDTEIIVVGESVDDLVVLEGNARAAQGYRLPAVVGISPRMSEWKYYLPT